MTTTQLNNYLIACDRQYPGVECHRDVFIQAATDKVSAEYRAHALGWAIGLMAGCPACERWWAERESGN